MSGINSEAIDACLTFKDLDLAPNVLKALVDSGYEKPSAIQSQAIPKLLAGLDVVGQAQTGTGKTAAFALPLLSRLDANKKETQILVLAPTRELGIQVAEAFKKYAAHIPGFHVLPIYGGQSYDIQLRQLKRGPMVVVGTPGRVMDHIRRGTLKLDGITAVVLDEADEMLKMGFLEDVEWILDQTPEQHQIALFSATMPDQIRRIAKKYLDNPHEITVKTKTSTVQTIKQKFCLVSQSNKFEALNRFLEVETFDAALIFARTKTATIELEEQLRARGFSCAALNGDIPQSQRERTVEHLKSGKLDILVATDVAARGLDIDRVSHVFNYDIPYDTEAYVHRIGRTGRAGRNGEAILFVTAKEKRMLQAIERATRQQIELVPMPSIEEINKKRKLRFKQKITNTFLSENWKMYLDVIEEYKNEFNVPPAHIAAAIAILAQGETPLELSPEPKKSWTESSRESSPRGEYREQREPRGRRERDSYSYSGSKNSFRIEVGKVHGVKPGNIVGAIANEAGIDSQEIGAINIFEDYSTVDLMGALPDSLLKVLQNTWVAGQQLKPSRVSANGGQGRNSESRGPRDRSSRPPKKEGGFSRREDRTKDASGLGKYKSSRGSKKSTPAPYQSGGRKGSKARAHTHLQ